MAFGATEALTDAFVDGTLRCSHSSAEASTKSRSWLSSVNPPALSPCPFSCRHRVHVQPPHTSRGLRGTSGHLGAVRALGFTVSVGAWYERAQCLETRITVYPCLPLQTQTPLLQAPLIIPPDWIPRRRRFTSRRFPAGCKPNCYTQRSTPD